MVEREPYWLAVWFFFASDPPPREIWYSHWPYTQACIPCILNLFLLPCIFLWTLWSALPDPIDQRYKLQAESQHPPPELCPVSCPTHPPFTSHTHRLLSPCGQGNWSSLSLIQGQWTPCPSLLEGKKVQWTGSFILGFMTTWIKMTNATCHQDSREQCLRKPVDIYTRLSTLHPTWNFPNDCFEHNYQTFCNPDNFWMAAELACSWGPKGHEGV